MRGARLNRHTFEGVARAIRRAKDRIDPEYEDGQLDGVKLCAKNLADDFAEAANNFDRKLFMRNCGFEE